MSAAIDLARRVLARGAAGIGHDAPRIGPAQLGAWLPERRVITRSAAAGAANYERRHLFRDPCHAHLCRAVADPAAFDADRAAIFRAVQRPVSCAARAGGVLGALFGV